jgi:adenosylcobinamide-phosphate synthase
LAGPASYFGKTQDKQYIGDDTRPAQADDINKTNHMMYAASVLMLIIAFLFRALWLGVIV